MPNLATWSETITTIDQHAGHEIRFLIITLGIAMLLKAAAIARFFD